MKIRNLTPHPIVLQWPDGQVKTFEPGGIIPRAKQEEVQIGGLDHQFEGRVGDSISNDFPFLIQTFGETEGLPEEKEGTILIVSALAAQGCKGRKDVFVPARPVRDEQGRIIACQALARIE